MKSFTGLLKRMGTLSLMVSSRDIYGTYAILDRSYILHQYVDLFAHEHQLAFAFTILVLF